MNPFLVTFLGSLFIIGSAQLSYRVDGAFIPVVVIETALTAIGGYLCFMNIGTPLSNAQGTVIRSTVTSGLFSLIFVYAFISLVLSIISHKFPENSLILRIVFLSGLAVTIVSLPFLVYYNFYLSRTVVLSGKSYTIYPYAVQSGIPFLLGLVTVFLAIIFIFLSRRYGNSQLAGSVQHRSSLRRE